jgi:hypothetical protein
MQPCFDPKKIQNNLKKNENRRQPQKKIMEDDLNFKAVLLSLFNNNKPQKQMVLTP